MNFNELVQIVGLVRPVKVKQLDVLSKGHRLEGHMGVLYEGLLAERWRSEEEMVAWFQEHRAVSKDNLRQIMRKLFKKLSNTALFLDSNEPSFTDFQRAYYNCYRELAIFKVLLGRNVTHVAERMGVRLLRRAIRFEFVDIVIMVARELSLYYGTLKNNPREALKYSDLVSKYLDVFHAEIKAEHCYQEVVHLARSKASHQAIAELAARYAAELEPLVEQYDSYKLYLYAFNLFLLRHELQSDYEQMLHQATRAVELFLQKRHLATNTAIFSLRFRMLVAQIQLGRYDDGKQTAAHCMELVPEGISNWFLSLINYIILCLHSGDYGRAKDLFERAVSHSMFNRQDERIVEQFKVLEATLHYLHAIGQLSEPPAPGGRKRNFRLSRFLNDVPIFSKDKRGTNVLILILQILFLLQKRDYELVVNRLEALRVYSHRYLRKNETFRSNCFIRMLNTLPSARFHRSQAERKARPLLKKLQEIPLSKSPLGADIEVVPYERLWQFVLQSLSERRTYVY